MKKTIFTLLGIVAILLSACSDGGSKTITVSDTKIYDSHKKKRGSDVEQEMQRVISVVPGDYELTWAKSKDVSDMFIPKLSLKLKHDAVLNTDEFGFYHEPDVSLHVDFLDEAGNEIDDLIGLTMGAGVGDYAEVEAMVNSLINSEQGTIMEIPFFMTMVKSQVERLNTEVHGIRVTYIGAPHRLK